jgi:hypothetical protein
MLIRLIPTFIHITNLQISKINTRDGYMEYIERQIFMFLTNLTIFIKLF